MNVLQKSPGVVLFEFLIAKNSIDANSDGHWHKIRAIERHAQPQQGKNNFGSPSMQRVEITEKDTPFVVYHCSREEYQTIVEKGYGLRPPIGRNLAGVCHVPIFMSATDGLIKTNDYDPHTNELLTPWPKCDENNDNRPVIAPYEHPGADNEFALYISVRGCAKRGIKLVQSPSLAVTTMQIISSDDILMARRKNGYMAWCHRCLGSSFSSTIVVFAKCPQKSSRNGTRH